MARVDCNPQNVEYTIENGDTDYSLTIVIGNGVQSTTTYRNPDGNKVQKEHIKDELIGKGSAIMGAMLIPATPVSFIPAEVDEMRIEYYINGDRISVGTNKRADDPVPLFRPKIRFVEPS